MVRLRMDRRRPRGPPPVPGAQGRALVRVGPEGEGVAVPVRRRVGAGLRGHKAGEGDTPLGVEAGQGLALGMGGGQMEGDPWGG